MPPEESIDGVVRRNDGTAPSPQRVPAAPPTPNTGTMTVHDSTANHIWSIILATSATQAVMAFAAMTLASIAPEASRDIGVSASLVGYQVGLTFGSGILSALYAGRMIRRLGACRTSQIGLALTTVGCALIAAGHLGAIVAASIVIGLAYGVSNPSASHLINRFSAPANRNLFFSIKQAGVPLGGVLAGLIAPRLAVTYGWQSVPLFVLALTVLLALVLQTVRTAWDDDRSPVRDRSVMPFEALAILWNIAPIRWLTLGSALYVMVMLSLTGFLVTILVEELGFSLVSAGIVLSVVQAFAVVARLAFGWLADRRRDGLRVLFWIGVAATLGAIGTTLADPRWPSWCSVVLFVFFGFSAMGWVGVFYGSLANLSPPGMVGTITGGALAVFYVGIIVGPSVVAATYSVVGSYTASFAIIALIAAGGTACIFLARRAGSGRP